MYPLLVLLPEDISFSLMWKSWMQVMAYSSSGTGDIIPNYLYYVYQPSQRPPKQPPKQPQYCRPPRTSVGVLTSSTDTNPNKISWTDTGPEQTPPTDVRLRPNIINRPWSRVNPFFPPPQLPLWRRDWSHPIGASTKYLQQTMRLPRSPSGLSQDAKTIPNFFQQTPRSHKLSPTETTTRWNIVNRRQEFRTWRRDPP